jgi:NAD(P)H-dependent flavin oxidoreductase YrpB (nitropropane dioxygenase family)
MKLPPLKIGNLFAAVPIIQGGMGVGVSRSRLASAVANEGGVGVISAVQIGFEEPDFETNTKEANIRALRNEIRKAKELSSNGVIAVNIMVAINNYKEIVNASVEENIDLIISGAGLPTDLPNLVKGSNTKIAPVVSSGKAAMVITKLWDHKFSYIPDLVVVEGPEAGGHLGFSLEQLTTGNKPKLLDIVKDVIEALKPYEKKYGKSIPVVAAGGVYNGKDIVECLGAGAAGVQMATRFVATEECDAHINYKMAYINSCRDNIEIVKSPVGMPGRAIHNSFLDKLEGGRLPVRKCYDCLKPCEPANTPYCISKALIEAVKGNIDEGLIFSGSNAYKLNKIVTVKELMNELISEVEQYSI